MESSQIVMALLREDVDIDFSQLYFCMCDISLHLYLLRAGVKWHLMPAIEKYIVLPLKLQGLQRVARHLIRFQ